MTFQRFSGSSGVFQMIALLESCSKSRRQHLFDSMTSENPGLSALVKTKLLTIDHITDWSSVELRKLSAELPNELRGRLFSVLYELGQVKKLKELGVPLDTKFRSIALSEHDQLDVLIVLKARELERIGILEMWRFDPAKSTHDQVLKQGQADQSKAA
jgi:hypothetical protein